MSTVEAVVLFGAAVVAGAVNSIAGGGSLISFPALVWAGYDPVIANATNTLAVSPGAFAAMIPFRRELATTGRWIRLLGPPSLIGGAIGAWILLATPSKWFSEIVPFLVLFATGMFALQEAIVRAGRRSGEREAAEGAAERERARAPGAGIPAVAVAVQLVIAVYGGYFGAGIGIMLLAAMGYYGLRDLHHMIGLRSLFGLLINGIAAAYFAFSGKVSWPAAGVMIVGQMAGGYGGAWLARRVPREWVRVAVVVIGVAMAGSLYFLRR